MSNAALRSSKCSERGVMLSAVGAEEQDTEEGGPAVSKETGSDDKEASAPETSEAEGLSSGLAKCQRAGQ